MDVNVLVRKDYSGANEGRVRLVFVRLGKRCESRRFINFYKHREQELPSEHVQFLGDKEVTIESVVGLFVEERHPGRGKSSASTVLYFTAKTVTR